MAYVYTLANAKGGCGKSTVAFNLAVSFARKGYQTLAIDLDQQGNLSGAFGVDLNKLKLTTHRLLIDEQADISLFLLEPRPRLKLLPNTIDIVIVDTPPAMRAATLNGLAVADTTIVPVDSSFFALLGLNQLLQVIAAIRDAHQPNMVLRALTTHFNRRQNLYKQIRRQVEDFFGPDLVLQTPIHKSVGIVEAIMLQKAAIEYSAATSGAFDFNKLTQELIEDIADEQAPFRSALG